MDGADEILSGLWKRRALIWILLFLIFLSPVAVGIFDVLPYGGLAAVLFVFARNEYANLFLEGKRLKTSPTTSVVWLIFPGNDLDEPYDKELEVPPPLLPPPGTSRRPFFDQSIHGTAQKFVVIENPEDGSRLLEALGDFVSLPATYWFGGG